MPSMSRKEFLRIYGLELEKEFEFNGQAASWAPLTAGRPQEWGEETRSMDLVQSDTKGSERSSDTAEMAFSPDGAFVAIATNSVIRVYISTNWELRAELIGHLSSIGKIMFLSLAPDAVDEYEPKYVVLSQDTADREQNYTIIPWRLDNEGRFLGRTMPFAIDYLTDKAIGAISEDLTVHHELPDEEIGAIRKSFLHDLKTADTKNRTKDTPKISGKFPSFGSNIVSSDGQYFLTLTNNRTTQHGMRPEESLPRIIVRLTTDPTKTIHTLPGHTDAIMWASFSPVSNTTIASASWDQHFRIWDTSTTPPTSITIRPTGGQNWSGAFSPDGQHILFAGTKHVAIYSVSTGKEIHKLEDREDRKLESWIRYLSWSPSRDEIALCNGNSIILWEPFEDKETEIVKLKQTEQSIMRSFTNMHKATWFKGGDLLVVVTGDASVLVWDKVKNWKWRFQRPGGRELDLYAHCVSYDEETDSLVTLNGDRKLREWKLS